MGTVSAATAIGPGDKRSVAQRHPVSVLVARRVGTSFLLLIAVSILIFVGCQLLPGDAANAILGRDATPQALEALRATLHLNEPAPQRYLDWIGGVLHGDLGYSATQDSKIWPLISGRIVASLILAGVTIAVLIPLSLVLGVLAASRAGRATDRVISGTSVTLIAVPEFVSGTLLALLFGVTLSILPAVSYFPPGSDPLATPTILVLPCLTLLCASVAQTLRMVRAGMIDALRSEYVAAARLNGFPERTVVTRVALRNSLAPTIQVVALNLQWLVGGIVVTETLFNYPGLGQELVTAVTARDIPLVQSIALLIAVFYFAVNIVTDVLLIAVVPRLRTAT